MFASDKKYTWMGDRASDKKHVCELARRTLEPSMVAVMGGGGSGGSGGVVVLWWGRGWESWSGWVLCRRDGDFVEVRAVGPYRLKAIQPYVHKEHQGLVWLLSLSHALITAL